MLKFQKYQKVMGDKVFQQADHFIWTSNRSGGKQG